MNIPYFYKCTPRHIHLVRFYFHEKEFQKGQIVCNVGDLANNIYIIINGEFEV